jgi:hypothetical protein
MYVDEAAVRNPNSVPVWLKVVLVLVVGGAACSWLWLELRYHFAFERAMSAYRASRGPGAPPIDSDDFATWGIRYGYTEAQVDQVMQHASEKSGRMVDPTKPGFQKDYVFDYGSVFALGHETTLMVERVWVFFDDSGKAVRIERDLFVHGDVAATGMREFNLTKNADSEKPGPSAQP